MAKQYNAIAPDGKTPLTISGPENATKEQLSIAFQAAWDKVKPKLPEQSYSQTKAAVAPAKMEAAPQGIGQTFVDVLKHGLMGNYSAIPSDVGGYFTKNTLNDKIADIGNLTRDAASGVSGAVAGELTASPIAASATMAYMDQLLRKVTGQGTGSSLSDNPILAGAAGTLENEIGGRILGTVGKVMAPGKLIDRVPGVTAELKNLEPTYAQFDPAITGSDIIEDFFARGKKIAGIANSTAKARARANELITDLTIPQSQIKLGVKAVSNPARAELIKAENENAFSNFVRASNKEADNAIATAELFQHQLPQPPTITPVIVPDPMSLTGGTKIVQQAIPNPPKIIPGPVWFNHAIPDLVSIRKELIPTSLTPNPDTPVFRAIDQIFTDMNAKFTPAGDLLFYDPIPFKQAWNNKQIIDRLGYGDLKENLSAADSRFKRISSALNKDIDESIPKWSNLSSDIPTLQAANDAWQTSKQIVAKRHELFSPAGEVGRSTDTLLNSVNAPSKDVDAILGDYKKLSRFLESGETTINGRKVTSTNGRRDMQGYVLEKMFNDHWSPTDPNDITKGVLNGDKLASSWTEFVSSPEGKKLFGTKDGPLVQRYNDFFDAVRKTTNDPNGSNRWVTMNIGSKALSLGSAILAGNYGAGHIGATGVVSGAAGLGVLARVMTSKKYGPALLGLMHGRPLGMSFQAAARGIIQSMSGSHITLNNDDGTSTEALVSTDGKIRPLGKQ